MADKTTNADIQKNSQTPASKSNGDSAMVSTTQGPQPADVALSSLTSGGMRGIGLVAFLIAQIVLKQKTLKIAKDYYKTAKRDLDFFVSTHQPGTIASVTEAMSEVSNPKYKSDLYASAPAGIAKSKVVELAWFAARRRTARYNVGVMERLDYDMAILRTSAAISGWNMARRYEMAWADAHNERRFNRKLAMANVGIGVGNIVREGLATSVGKLTSASNELTNTVASIGNGYFAKQGYEDARKDTKARFDRET